MMSITVLVYRVRSGPSGMKPSQREDLGSFFGLAVAMSILQYL